MADSDPKKVRVHGQTAEERRSYDAEEDPLVELARIVSEDGGFYGSKPERPKPLREEAIDRGALSADLEAELLHELESSFSTRAAGQAAASRSTSAPQAEESRDDSDNLLRSIEEQLGAFERRARAGRPSPAVAEQDPAEGYAEDSETADSASAPEIEPEPQTDWTGRRDTLRPAEEPRVAPLAKRDEENRRSRVSAQPRSEPAFRRNPNAPSGWEPTAGDRSFAKASRTGEPSDVEPTSKFASEEPKPARIARPLFVAEAAGWNDLADDSAELPKRRADRDREITRELRTTFAGFNERREPEETDSTEVAAAVDAELGDEVEPRYSEPGFGSEWQDSRADLVSEDATADIVPPPELARSRQAPRRRSRGGLMAAAAILGLVVIGGGLAAYLRSGDEIRGEPPVIAAEPGAVKVEAPQNAEQASKETVGDAVYQRVSGGKPAAEDAAGEQVVDHTEEPQEIPRIVLPSTATVDDQPLERPVGEGEGGDAATAPAPANVAAEAPPEDAPVGPRKVQTFAVRPDGSIVPAGAPTTELAVPSAEQDVAMAAPGASDPIEPVSVPTTDVNAAGDPESAPATDEAPATAPAAAAEPADPAPAVEPDAAPTETAAVLPAPPAVVRSRPAGATKAPVDLLSGAGTAAAAPATTSSEGYVVQVSSQKDKAAAQSSFAAMKSRYPSILGGLDPQIQEADLGAKGVYYRVRVGPWGTRAEAISVCEKLKAAGGSCFVAK